MMRKRYMNAPTFLEYMETVEQNTELWKQIYKRVEIADEVLQELQGCQSRWYLLVLSEDWCSDAVNLVPVVACLARDAHNLDLRVLARDENLDIMDTHLTNGRSRSIPVVILLDEDFVEKGWWGPRPASIQKWFMEKGMNMASPERSKHTRRYYAKDKGRTMVSEIMDLIRSAS